MVPAFLYIPQTPSNTFTWGGNQDCVWNLHHISTTLSLKNVFSFRLTPQPSVACWQLVVPKMSHAVDSGNLNSLFLVSVTCLQMPKELHFHYWLLRTPVPAGRAGKLKRLPPSSLPLPSLPPQRMKKIQRCHFNCTDTGLLVVGFSFKKKKKLRSW